MNDKYRLKIGGPDLLKKLHSKDISYNSIKCDDVLDTPTKIIARWNVDRSEIVKKLTDSDDLNYKDITEIIPYDQSCKCIDGKAYISSSCTACSLLSKIFKNGIILDKSSTKIKNGKYKHKEFVLNSFISPDENSGYYLSTKPKKIGNGIMEEFKEINTCETLFYNQVNNVNFWKFRGNYEEHKTLISFILEHELNKKNIPCLLGSKWIYKCSKQIKIINQVFKRISVDDLYKKYDPDIVTKGLLTQLIVNLEFLSNYAFTHGGPNIDNIIIIDKPCSYVYETLKVDFPFSMGITPGGYSSITCIDSLDRIIRFYYNKEGSLPSLDIEIKPFINYSKNCGCQVDSEYLKIRTLAYKINNNFFEYIRMGIPLFYSSLDMYCFLVILSSNEHFKNNFLKGELWKNLFNVQDHTEFQKKLGDRNFMNVLKDTYLRCDGLSFAWESIKSGIF